MFDITLLGRKPALAAAIGLALGVSVWLLSGVYSVAPGQVAVLYRLGVLSRLVGPGYGYNLPRPFGQATLVSTSTVNRVEGGARGEGGAISTADGRLAEVRYAATWRVSDPVLYLRGMAAPEAAVKAASEAAINATAAQRRLSDFEGPGLKMAQVEAARRAQAILDGMGAGVRIDAIEITGAELPAEVREDPLAVVPDAAAEIKTAEEQKAARLAKARTEAAGLAAKAGAERGPALEAARQDAARFDALLADSKGDPDGAGKRLYAETMARVLGRSNRIIIDAPDAKVVLPSEMMNRASGDEPKAEGAQ